MGNILTEYSDRVRYTLHNNTYGTIYITEPIGWNEDEKQFSRNKTYHGVFTTLSNNLKFIKDSKDFIQLIYDTLGINADLRLVKESKHSQLDIWEPSYFGYLDLSTYELENNQITCKFNSGGLESILKSRETEDVEIGRLDTIDEKPIDELDTVNIEIAGRRIFLESVWDIDPMFNYHTISIADTLGHIRPNQLEEATVGCIYNLQDYEVYEFDINFLDFQNTEIQIEIKNSDPNFQNYIWKSEIIRSNESLEKYLEIRYYNSTNTNIVYATGIKHLLRLPFNTIKAIDSDTSENYNSDTNTYLLDSKIYEITEFDFMPFPLELWRKLKIALSIDTVFIDGIGYLKNTEFTKENLGSTNLYKVTAQMIKNGFVFNSNLNSNEIIIENVAVNLPGLLTTNSNEFIEY